MNASIVEVKGLWHRYSGANWAISDINFDIDRTGVLGLLGSNGAGKSTTMNIMCGVLKPTKGSVFIDGIDLNEKPEEAKMQLGFLPQTPPLHLDLTVDEYLVHCAYLRRMNKHEIPAALKAAKDRCGIAHFSNRLIRNLSGGYRQRVGIAQSIIHSPKLVVLDEPTNGLDPIQIFEVRNLIRDIASERAVIFSSHILSEIQATCRDVIMIEGGRLVFRDTMVAFNSYCQSSSLIAVFQQLPVKEALLAIPGIKGVEVIGPQHVRLAYGGEKDVSQQVIAASNRMGWPLVEISYEKSSLEEVFAQLSGRAVTAS